MAAPYTRERETAAEAVLRLAAVYPSRDAVVDGSGSVTFGELGAAIRLTRERLLDGGIKRGDRVVVLLPNGAGWIIVASSLRLVGSTPVLVDVSTLPTNQLARVLEETGAVGAIASRASPADLPSARAEPMGEELVLHWMSSHHGVRDRPARVGGAVFYTSGVTSRPKGVVHTERSLMAGSYTLMRVQRRFLLGLGAGGLRTLGRHLARAPGELGKVALGRQVWSTHISLASISGFQLMQTALLSGYTFATDERFTPRPALRLIERARVNVYAATPPMAELLLRVGKTEGFGGRHLMCIGLGGAPVSARLTEDLKAAFGCLVTVGYGATELGGGIAAANQRTGVGRTVVGLGLRDVHIRIVDKSGHDVAAGTVGELCVRAPRQAMAGYLGDRDDGAEDGWYRTGDLGMRVRGGYTILGRVSRTINRGGRKIEPEAVETALQRHPAVRRCRVVGVAGRLGSEEILALVESDGSKLSPQDLRQHCRSLVPGFMVPTRVVIRDGSNLSGSGKVQMFDIGGSPKEK